MRILSAFWAQQETALSVTNSLKRLTLGGLGSVEAPRRTEGPLKQELKTVITSPKWPAIVPILQIGKLRLVN